MRHALAAEVQLQGQVATAAAWGSALAVGTYALDQQSGTRQGSLLLFEVQQGSEGGARAVQTGDALSCAGVFEAAWDPGCSTGLLGAALADGSLAFWALGQAEAAGGALLPSASCQAFGDAALSTNLAFEPGGAHDRRVAATSSAGEVAVLAQVLQAAPASLRRAARRPAGLSLAARRTAPCSSAGRHTRLRYGPARTAATRPGPRQLSQAATAVLGTEAPLPGRPAVHRSRRLRHEGLGHACSRAQPGHAAQARPPPAASRAAPAARSTPVS